MKSLIDKQSAAQTFSAMRLMGTLQHYCPQVPDEENHSILREEVDAAIKGLKIGKSVDNLQAGEEDMIDVLTSVCKKTKDWLTKWT